MSVYCGWWQVDIAVVSVVSVGDGRESVSERGCVERNIVHENDKQMSGVLPRGEAD